MRDYKRREVVALLNEAGFYSASVGEHEIFTNANGARIPLPQHRVISPGTMRDIIKRLKAINSTVAKTKAS